MPATTVLITGANTGIGYEVVKALCQSDREYRVILGGRSIEKARAAAEQVIKEVPGTKSTVDVVQIDVESDESINAAAAHLTQAHGGLDVLVNNAGANPAKQVHEGTLTMRQCFNAVWDVNVTGTYILTMALAPLLIKSSDGRIIFLTSGMASLEESQDSASFINPDVPAGWPKPDKLNPIPAYRSAKVGLNMVMRHCANIFKNDGVKVWSVAPGLLATGLGGDRDALVKMGAGDPSLGGISLRKVIEGDRDADAGKIVRNYSTPVQPW